MTPGSDIIIEFKELQLFYNTYFAYYRSLNTEYKSTFVRRCILFLESKLIEGTHGFEPDNRVKALVAASAVQLTLGLEVWELDYFDIIILHATDFNSNSGLKYSGETNLGGYVQLSWKSFLKGYSVNNDNINLGLHEFTHALRFNDLKGHGQDYFIENYFDNWLSSAYVAFNDLRSGKPTIFRAYGGTNINEFMSVCIEHFFESPQQIKQTYPLLYYSTACLLNQLPGSENTQINVRKQMLTEKSITMKGFEMTELYSPVSAAMLVSVIPLLFTLLLAGLTSVISLLVVLLFVCLYLRYDFKHTQMEIIGREFKIYKGKYIFKNRKLITHPIGALLSFRQERDAKKDSYEVLFFDAESGYFFEEDLILQSKDAVEFNKELNQNRITLYM